VVEKDATILNFIFMTESGRRKMLGRTHLRVDLAWSGSPESEFHPKTCSSSKAVHPTSRRCANDEKLLQGGGPVVLISVEKNVILWVELF
jgi:hypothetical protein